MSEKLLTVPELAEYLGLSEERVRELVENRVISAYRIGGELLRFRREQIDAIRSEIDSFKGEAGGRPDVSRGDKVRERLKTHVKTTGANTFTDAVADFFYFNDFYIFSAIIIAVLLVLIFRG
jgi:excisionase family DNA binding protein